MELKRINFPHPIEGSETSMIIYRRNNLAREKPEYDNKTRARHEVTHAIRKLPKGALSISRGEPGYRTFLPRRPPGAIL